MIELNEAEHEQGTIESGDTYDHQPRAWRVYGLFSKLVILVLLVLSAASFLLPFTGHATLNRLSAMPNGRPFVHWLVNQNGSWILGIGFLGLLLAFILIKRFQIVRDQQLWYDTGCPQCFERELIRVPRKRSDRWYVLVALPAHRYACRNCTWQGLRIARRHYRPEPLIPEPTVAEVDGVLATAYESNDIETGDEMELVPATTSISPADPVADYANGEFPAAEIDGEGESVEVVDNSISYEALVTEETEADEEWEPFAGDELDEDLTYIEQVSGAEAADPLQPEGNQADDPTNHKVREPDDEFDWLWQRLGQNK
jgi:hypothetical protein